MGFSGVMSYSPSLSGLLSGGSTVEDVTMARVTALKALVNMDATQDPVVVAMCKLLCSLLKISAAGVSLVDKDRQWLNKPPNSLASASLRSAEHYLPKAGETLIVEDTTADKRTDRLPFVVGEPYARFYASVPLMSSSGSCLGHMCVMDLLVRSLDEAQLSTLKRLSDCIARQLEKDNFLVLQAKTYKALEHSAESVKTAVLMLDMAEDGWIIKFANSVFARVSGVPREELIDAKFWDIFEPALPANEDFEARVTSEDDFTTFVRRKGGAVVPDLRIQFKPSSSDLLGLEKSGDSGPAALAERARSNSSSHYLATLLPSRERLTDRAAESPMLSMSRKGSAQRASEFDSAIAAAMEGMRFTPANSLVAPPKPDTVSEADATPQQAQDRWEAMATKAAFGPAPSPSVTSAFAPSPAPTKHSAAVAKALAAAAAAKAPDTAATAAIVNGGGSALPVTAAAPEPKQASNDGGAPPQPGCQCVIC